MSGNDDSAGSASIGQADLLSAGVSATISPAAQRFLPPALWHQLAGADLSATAPPRRGLLLNAQERLRSLLFLLSTYLPAHLVQQKMRRPTAGQVDGRLLNGTFLFSDVSGFTALSERLAVHPDGAERLTELVNAYMAAMLDVLSRSGGVLIKFAGDALLAYFPVGEGAESGRGAVVAPGLAPAAAEGGTLHRPAAQAAARAGRAAFRMLEAMAGLAGGALAGAGPLRIKIGLGTGDCLAAAVGDQERMEYFLLGGAVARMMAAESHASAGQVVCDADTARLLDGPPAHGICWQVTPTRDAPDYYTLRLVPVGEQARPGDGDGPGEFDLPVRSRRLRGAVSWSASHHAVAAQIEIIVRQIEALVPFLAPELVDRIIAGAARRQVESEYRPAVVIFVNVAGPEQFLPGQDAGPVEAAGAVRQATRLLDSYFRAVHRIVADHGGVVARVDPYGDGSKMLILFGAPVAHEDDAARAVGAALAMNEAVAALDERHQRRAARAQPRVPAAGAIRHRLGITRGLTFAGQAGSNTRREYTVMGDDVNLAARLMGAAQWGQILVSRPVRDEVADHFSFTPLDPIRVKGKRHPVDILAVRARIVDTAPPPALPGVLCVGRAPELGLAQRLFEAALVGQGGLLAIGGAPGIGKTCLARALAVHARERGARVFSVECRAYAAPPYAPWCALLHDLFDVPQPDPALDDGATRQHRLLAALDTLGLDAARHAPALATLMGISLPDRSAPGRAAGGQGVGGGTLFSRLESQLEGHGPAPAGGDRGQAGLDLWQLARARRAGTGRPEGGGPEPMWHRLQERVASRQQVRLAEALAEALRAASAVQPLVVVIDHAQWLDDASRALLDLLASRLAHASLLLLIVGRLDGGAGPGLASPHGETAPNLSVIQLDPLDAAATTLLARHWLATLSPDSLPGLDEALAAALYRRSGGNPLFLEELLRAGACQPGGQADLADGHHDGGHGGGADYFAGLVLSRVDALSPGPRHTVRAASVIGDLFYPGEVEALLATPGSSLSMPASERNEPLGDPLSSLVAAGLLSMGENGGQATYAFRQALVREVIYRSHSFARRRELHAALAAYLALQPGADVALLAHHYELAGQPESAARHLFQSARRARVRYAFTRAIADCRRALAALADLPAEQQPPAVAALQQALCVEMGDSYLLSGDFAAAVDAYGEALTAGEGGEGHPHSPAHLPALAWRHALALAGAGRIDDALAQAGQAWTTGEDRSGEAGWPGICPQLDLLAIAAILSWLLAPAGTGQALAWLDRVRSLAGEAHAAWPDHDLAGGGGSEIERLVTVVEEMAAGGDDADAVPLILTALNELYEAWEDRHG